MENATKALIIATSVIIVLLVICLSLYRDLNPAISCILLAHIAKN